MLEKIFDKTVDLIESISRKTNIGYKELNVLGMFAYLGVTAALAYKAFHKKK